MIEVASIQVAAKIAGSETSNWDGAVRYGFIVGGGGTWCSNTLLLLTPGARVGVNVPGTGYVGVGEVTERRVPVEGFLVTDESAKRVPITDLPLKIAAVTKSTESKEDAEYLVRVKWIKTVPLTQAVRERGFFGNQNTVARPRAPKWDHTIERLKARFGVS